MTPVTSFDPSTAVFLNGLNQIQRSSTQAQLELTSGLKINSVSDSPSQIPELMQIHQQLDQAQQLNSNLTAVQTEVNTGESSLQSAVTLMEQAQSLTTEGQSGFDSATTRQTVAAQLGDVLQEMVSLANTTSNGRFIFSGDSDQTQPYSIDLTQTNPVSAYAGSASTREIQSPDGSTFPVALTAQDIFDSSDPTTNVFQSINNAREALLNNDQTGIDSAITSQQSSDTYLNTQLAFYGQTQDQITNGLTFGSNLVTQLQTQLSGVQDADMTQAITQMTEAQTDQQAALQSEAQIPRSSLFQYLG
jgi:flagellar hook-associated protein 3 FlgL